MTFTGKLSRGCESCRRVHVKCNEECPKCSRCVRLDKVCSGGKEEVDLMFRFESGKSSLKVSRKKELRKVEYKVAPPFRTGCFHGAQCEGNVRSLMRLSLSPSQDNQVLCYFYEFMMGTISRFDHSIYLHSQLPTLLSRSRQQSVLYLATQAISYRVYSKSRGNNHHTVRISRKCYVQAIDALKTAIRDPIEAKTDETLYAVLLLCGYETIAFDWDARSAWESHVNGAVALLRARGDQRLLTPLQCNMFLFIRRNAIHSYAQLSRPVDLIFDDISGITMSYVNTEDRLLSKTIKVPLLQSLANKVLSQTSRDFTERQTSELIQTAKDLDDELADWAKHVPPEWTYSVATNLNSTLESQLTVANYVTSELHRYPDFYIARVWNSYRVSRLIIQSIIMRITSCKSGDQETHDINIEKLSHKLVNDVCASVPFLLGYDLGELKRYSRNIDPQDKSLWPQSLTSNLDDNLKNTGRFSLIWPLHLSSSVLKIPECQQRWMRAQLQWIAEQGEPQAKLICQTQSQTLLGHAEDFRFDCI